MINAANGKTGVANEMTGVTTIAINLQNHSQIPAIGVIFRIFTMIFKKSQPQEPQQSQSISGIQITND